MLLSFGMSMLAVQRLTLLQVTYCHFLTQFSLALDLVFNIFRFTTINTLFRGSAIFNVFSYCIGFCLNVCVMVLVIFQVDTRKIKAANGNLNKD